MLGHFDLHAFVVMPNHVHLLATPSAALPKLTRSLKGITSKRANAILGLTGTPFWQEESYDHAVRSGELRRFGVISRKIRSARGSRSSPVSFHGRARHGRQGGRPRTRGSALLLQVELETTGFYRRKIQPCGASAKGQCRGMLPWIFQLP
jgi:putative transposase